MRRSQELSAIRGTWANLLKHEDDGVWPRITGDKRYWANLLKHEDDEVQPRITGDRRHWAN